MTDNSPPAPAVPAQPATPLPAEQIAKLTPAEKLDYARRFDQSKMPAWRDPRSA
jgi:hypothetical protein